MNVYCAILGFRIDREMVCTASGNHPPCRKCMGRKEKADDNQTGRRRARKHCACGRVFLPKSNRQEHCERCRRWNDDEKARLRMANFRRKAKIGLAVTV